MNDSHETSGTDAFEIQPPQVDMQAIEWLIELKSRELPPDRWLSFETWLCADPVHTSTYHEFEEHWRRLEFTARRLPEMNEDDCPEHERFVHLFRSLYCSRELASSVTSLQEETARRDEQPVVFMSCSSSADAPAVQAIADQLRLAALDPWIEVEDPPMGSSGFMTVVDNVLHLCAYVLVILSSTGLSRRGLPPKRTLQLLNTCRDRMQDRSRLIAVRLDACRVHRSLEHLAYVDLFADSGWSRLMGLLHRNTVHWLTGSASARVFERGSQPMLCSQPRHAHQPSLHRKVQTFPAQVQEFLVSTAQTGTIAPRDETTRRFLELTSCRLRPIVQVHPSTLMRDLLGFQCLALGPNGENFDAISTRCQHIDGGVLRICAAIAALETIAKLRADISFRAQGRSRLKFLLHLDSPMLESSFLWPLFTRYWDELDDNLLFEISSTTADRHYDQLLDLHVEMNVGYAARDLHRWSDEARSALTRCIAVTKTGYGEFRGMMDRRKYDPLTSLRNLRMSQVRGAPFVISGLNHRRDLRRLCVICADGAHGDLYGQGDAIDAGQQWNAKTPPLKVFGVPTSGRALMRSPG